MLLEYQRDSYSKELVTRVLLCEAASLPQKSKDGEGGEFFRIILEDTVLFPEGGGQPDDRGVIDDVMVSRVLREDNKVAHYARAALPVGKEVLVKLDWKRRFDHMQQHSAQHLITAVAEKELAAPTTSWWLGETSSYIELDIDINKFTETDSEKLESIVNDHILLAEDVKVVVYEEGDEKLKEAKTRGLPDGHKGQVRVVSMGGLDQNMCCGTHVKNLAQLQAIKIISFEKGKKGKTNLHFVAGGRTLSTFGRCLNRQKQISALLRNGPEDHVALLEKLQKSWKLSEKKVIKQATAGSHSKATELRRNGLKSLQNQYPFTPFFRLPPNLIVFARKSRSCTPLLPQRTTCSSLWKEVSKFEAEKFKALTPRPAFYEIYRKEGSPDFVSTFIGEVKAQAATTLFALFTGDDKEEGQVTIVGPPEAVSAVGPKVADLLGGKGAAAAGRFQAKVSNMKRRKEATELMKAHISLP